MLKDKSVDELIKNHRDEIIEEIEQIIKQYPIPDNGYKTINEKGWESDGSIIVNLGANWLGSTTSLNIPSSLLNDVSIFKSGKKKKKQKEPLTAVFANSLHEEKPTKTHMVRQGGHFTELMDYNKHNRDILDEFNTKNNATVLNETSEIEDIGIKLSSSESKLVTAIRSLLFDKSENRDENSERFYMGNYFPNGKIVQLSFSGRSMDVPHLLIQKNELYKAYLGQDSYSGKEQKNIEKLLVNFCERQFKTVYKQHIEVNGKTQVNRITDYAPLIRLKKIEKGLTIKEDELISKGISLSTENSQYLITLNPIWVDQIKTKWVEYPHDLNQRLGKSVKHGNEITPATHTLVNYLFHQRSTKNYITEINENNLFIKLDLYKYISRRKRKLAETYLEDAIRICKKIGLCQKAETAVGVQGQKKWIFTINKEMSLID